MSTPDRSELRDIAAVAFPRWTPGWAAAITLTVAAASHPMPSAVTEDGVFAAFILNAAIATGGSAAGGFLGHNTLSGGVAATFGAGALGLTCYVGLICVICLVFMQPVVIVLCGGVWIVTAVVTRLMC